MTLRSRLIRAGQGLVLQVSYAVHRGTGRERRAGYVFGVEEVAGILHGMADAYPEAVSVRCNGSSFYAHGYDYDLAAGSVLRRLLLGPWVLGSLARRRELFVYVGGSGFLAADRDGRGGEFSFLRRRGCRIVCVFTGSDIRSPAKMDEFGQNADRDVMTTFLPHVTPGVDPDRRERAKKVVASAADRFADLIINPPVDQSSYLERETHPFLYFCPDSLIGRRADKWDREGQRLRVVHAPSSPILKGTPIVRAAVKGLQEEGYDFDYIEISNRKHDEVLAILEGAHVVLNEFYALLPGVLGVEAMACNAVLLTAADANLEPSLASGANDAWVVTPYWLVQEHLRQALDGLIDLQAQADRGTDWVKMFCSQTACRSRFDALISALPEGAKQDPS